jgi:exosortase
VSEASVVDRSDPAPSGLAARRSSPLLWLALVVAGLVAYVYQPLFFPDTHQEFTAQGEEFFFEANQSAGAPVLLLTAWLFYRRSHYFDLLSGTGSRVGGALVLGLTVALYAWGVYTGAPDLRLASVTLLFTGGALLLGGGAALRAFWLPIVFLLFALPLPPVLLSAVIFPIQLWTAEYAGVILNAIGVQSFVQGDQILRPENTFIVIETCSGVRTVVTLMMLTVLLIDLFERRGLHAWLLALLTPIVALLTNGLRVVTLVLNPHSSIHSVHNLQGVAMLLVGLTAIYLLDGLLERALGSRDPSAEAGDYGIANADVAPIPAQLGRLAGLAAVLVALIAFDLALPRWSFERSLAEMPDALLARVFGEDASYKVETDFQFTGSVRHLAHARRRVDIDGMPVDFHLGVADEQERRFTMLSPRLAWPESGFATIEKSDVALEPGGKPVRRMLLRRGARTLLSYSWFERRGSLWSEWWRQAAALDRSPFVRPEHMLAIRISTPVDRGDAGAQAAEARIRKAWLRVAPELTGYAPTLPVPPDPDAAEAAAPAPL